MVVISIFLKVGLFPFSSWIINIREFISWTNNIIIITWQKIIPTLILYKNLNIITISCLFTSTYVLNLHIIKISKIKPLLINSSLAHIRFIVITNRLLYHMPILYLFAYSIIIFFIVKLMSASNTVRISSQNKNKTTSALISLYIFRLRGMPPLLGFFIKLTAIYVIQKTVIIKRLTVVAILITTIRLYTYIQISLKNIIISKNNSSNKTNSLKLNYSYMGIITNIFTVPALIN